MDEPAGITTELARVNLDRNPYDWIKAFQEELGISSPLALRLVGGDAYPNLVRYAKHSWEKKALRKLLNIQEEVYELPYQDQSENFHAQMEERCKEASEHHKELKKLNSKSEGKDVDRNDKRVETHENAIRQRLLITSDAWIPKDVSLQNMIDEIQHMIQQIDSLLQTDSVCHDESALLQTVSNGRALQGIMLSKNLEEQLKIREQLLSVPENVQLLLASHPKMDMIEQFSNQQQEQEFVKTIEMFGYSALVPSKAGGLWGVCVDTSVALNKSESNSIHLASLNETQDLEDELYLSTVRYFTVPIASFAFSNSDLRLSHEALVDLEQIAIEILSCGPEGIDTKEKCENFFRKFGSHARRGPMHFGGAYWQKCSSKVFQSTELPSLGEIQRKAVVMQAFAFSNEQENSNWSNWIAKQSERCSETTISQTHLESKKIGGDSMASNLSMWRAGLVASNRQWSLIDCGTTLVPVWEIIKMNHSKEIQNAVMLADVLKRHWENMDDLPTLETTCTSIKQAEVLNEVSNWNTKSDKTSAKDSIQILVEVKEDLTRVSMNPQAWPLLYLSQDAIQQFLKTVVEQQQSSPSTFNLQLPTNFVQLLMQQLVHRADLNAADTMDFTLKCQLSKWLYGANIEEKFVLPMECEDFKIFQTYLQLAIQILEHTSKSNLQCYISVLTAAISRAISYFLQNLQLAEQKYEELFLTTLVYPFKYSTSYTPMIMNQLSPEDLRYLCDLLWDKSDGLFQTLASQNTVKLQAFLFHLAVDIYLNGSQDIAEHQVLNHLFYLKKEIGHDLESSVLEILCKHLPSFHIMDTLSQYMPRADITDIMSKYPSCANEWQLLETDLGRVAKFMLHTNGHSIENILNQVDSEIQSTSTPEAFDCSDDEIYHSCEEESETSMIGSTHFISQPDPNIIELFEELDLAQYHPQKLTLRDVLSIKRETLDATKCSDPKKLYIFLLQKIMAYDYRCRDNQLITTKSTTLRLGELTDEDFDSSDDEDDTKIHPMDALLALLHCSDDFLRQDLLARLLACKLSIPLILPDPFTGKLVFPLWAMRSIVKEWRSSFKGKIVFHESPLVSYPTHIVSFIRFGEQEKSKSKIMNTIISTSNHGHFFHRDCEGGSSRRLLGNGLLELCWYLPAGKETDIFPDLTTFLNLHGNALDHPRQIAFLSEVTFMTFAFITEEDLNDKTVEMLQQLSKTPGGIVLCTTSERKSFTHLSKDIPGELHCVTLKKKNEDGIKKTLQAKINKRLEQNMDGTENAAKKLEDCIDSALKHDIVVDERKEELQESQKKARELQQLIADHSDPHHCAKEVMLPLQGKDLWQEWAAQDKEEHRRLYRGDTGIEEYGAQKMEKKMSIRQNQLHCTKKLSPLMECFIVTLLNTSGDSRKYFLQCLKLYLDELSRNTIASWQLEHKKQRSYLKALQRNKKESGNESDSSLLQDCKQKIEQLHKKIIDASLGLEHLLRELGQVYEATQGSLRSNLYRRLPKLAAEILIDGYPLELMDGDAAHVPLEWVTAVLTEAVKLLTIDSKEPLVYVLSVLGLQSTGKSTLINTTFGLQFNVGAGRCTRGAFMQLLPISEDMKEEVSCDYVLVVDTEGLRAPELDSQKTQKHDNELATFVIGVANETIVNIYGEVPGDMDDILQTAVHAFIRMKSVKFNPSCQFVHQNVGAVAASDKSGMGRSKFTDKLDKMTYEAAKEEQREREYEYFSDVIHFEEDKDVHHFPGLWNGIPPMAHVNPEYGDKALSLKSHLVHRIMQSHNVKKLSAIQMHIEDVWTALLHEKFVFSFKNTLEITVYNSLEAKFSLWSWTFRSEMLDWERNAENEIKNSQGPEHLQQLKHRLLTEQLPFRISELHSELEKEMDKFFEESEQREMLSQWDVQTKHRLQRLKCNLQDHAQGFFQELIRSQQARADGERMKVSYEEEVIKKVRELIKEQPEEMLKKGKDDLEVEMTLRATFEKQWKGWMEDIAKKVYGSELYREKKERDWDILQKVLESILEFHKNEDHIVTKRLGQRALSERGKRLYLHLEEQHVRLNPKHQNWVKKLQSAAVAAKDYLSGAQKMPKKDVHVLKDESNRNFASLITDYAFERVEAYLESLSRQKCSFNPTFTIELLEKLKHAIDERSNEQTALHFTTEYRVDMSLTVCGYAARKFCDMAETFRQQHDPIAHLTREMKTPLFRLFKNTFLESADEKIAACTLCDLLQNSFDKQVMKSLPVIIFRDMKSLPWAENKAALKAQILLDLGEELQERNGNLNKYFLHLHKDHFEESLQYWLGKYTREHCEKMEVYAMEKWCKKLEKFKQKHRTKLVLLALHELKRLIKLVEEEAHKASEVMVKKKTEGDSTTEQGINVKEWLDRLLSEKLTKELDVRDLRRFHTFCDIKELRDIQNFEQELKHGLKLLQKRLKLKFKKLVILTCSPEQGSDEDQQDKILYIHHVLESDVIEHLYKQLCGCTEQCPFCGEQCDENDDEHEDKHHVIQHRSICLAKYREVWSGEMVPDVCSSMVGSDMQFGNDDTNGEYRPYKEYQNTYPNWKIPENMSAKTAFYWKWFLGNYSGKVAIEFGAKDNKIPREWNAYTWEQAKEELKKQYNI